jgi:hypothetical protein
MKRKSFVTTTSLLLLTILLGAGGCGKENQQKENPIPEDTLIVVPDSIPGKEEPITDDTVTFVLDSLSGGMWYYPTADMWVIVTCEDLKVDSSDIVYYYIRTMPDEKIDLVDNQLVRAGGVCIAIPEDTLYKRHFSFRPAYYIDLTHLEYAEAELQQCACYGKERLGLEHNEALLFSAPLSAEKEAELFQKGREAKDNAVSWIVYDKHTNIAKLTIVRHIMERHCTICNYPDSAKEWDIPENGLPVNYIGVTYRPCVYADFEIVSFPDIVLTELKVK